MAYIGNQTSTAFTSMAKQDITGNGGASYTLTHAVANEQEIEVFVNNVRQEPGVAYTVSGTALTMTGNVASSDDFYVVYQGKAVATTNHPSTQPLSATTGTFTGDLTVDTNTLKVDSTNNRVGINTLTPGAELDIESTGPNIHLNDSNGVLGGAITSRLVMQASGSTHGIVGFGTGHGIMGVTNAQGDLFLQADTNNAKSNSAIKFTVDNALKMTIDASGRVTMPNQPSFLARGVTGQPGVGGVFVFNGTDYNRGNHYSTTTGRFTAPVNGFYMFTCHVMSDGTDGRLMLRLFKNGTHMSQGSSSSNSSQYQDSRIAFMMYMAAGDYAEVKYQGNKGRYDNGATHNHFAGHLLG